MLPRSNCYTGTGQWFSVTLVSTVDSTLTFILKYPLAGLSDSNTPADIITYDNKGRLQDTSGFLDINNSYIDIAGVVPQYT